jgi:signal transduction histidine kinase
MARTNPPSYPLLRRLTLVQLTAFGLLIVIIMGVVVTLSTSHRIAYESQLRQIVKPKLDLDQERWRSWAALGLKGALSEEIQRAKESLPIKDLRVIVRSEISAMDNDRLIIIPEKDDGTSPYVVVATVGVDHWSEGSTWDGYVLGALAIALLAFLGVVIYSNLFIRAKIYEPIRRLNLAMTNPEESRRLAMSSVLAVGEIRVFVESISDLYEKARQAETFAAIARTTQMLAHDVRKPFSLLRMGMRMLGRAQDPEAVRQVLQRLMPEIDRAVSSVDGMISDVMEIGSSSTQLIKEPVSPESLIEVAIGEIFRVYPSVSISFLYDLHHVHMVEVHLQKVGRVFANIVGNAVQAIGQNGLMWFRTKQYDGFVEFCIGNSGSFVQPEDLPKLFDAFFTSGKKGGTGLGLAIAQKVVTAHGGKIWCNSVKTSDHPEGMVEFFFTLPVARAHKNKSTAILTRHSMEFVMAQYALAAVSELDAQSLHKGELSLAAEIIQASDQIGRPLRVLVVDDEIIYRHTLTSCLAWTAELKQALSFQQAANSDEALGFAKGHAYDLVITDVDMGPHSLNGFELVQELRAIGLKALICIHSNRIVAGDHLMGFNSGADAFLPKPIARAQLLCLVLQAAYRDKIGSVS